MIALELEFGNMIALGLGLELGLGLGLCHLQYHGPELNTNEG